MCDSAAQLYSTVYLSLGSPPSRLLSRMELGTILTRRLSYRLEAVRQSEQGVSIAKSAEITVPATSDEIDLTALIPDIAIPMWAEYRVLNVASNPVWEFLPTVNLSMLQHYRSRGMYACSFYGNNPSEIKMKISMYGNESIQPFNRIQVFYLPDIAMPQSEDAPIKLPDNLVTMVQLDTMVAAIPLIQVNGAKYVTDEPALIPQMAAMTGLLEQYRQEQREFEYYFDKWRRESRGGHRPRYRQDVLQNITGGRLYQGFYVNDN